MAKSVFKAALIAGAVAISVGAASSASANVPLKQFEFIESPGQYEVVNNSNHWYVYGFDVTNPLAGDPYEPWTTQTNWQAFACVGTSCFAGQSGFRYVNTDSITVLTNDIAPHSSSDRFFFGAPTNSKVLLLLTNGSTTTVSGVPEPATWATIILGIGMAGLALRRRRAIRA
jgi:hypothetical protein